MSFLMKFVVVSFGNGPQTTHTIQCYSYIYTSIGDFAIGDFDYD